MGPLPTQGLGGAPGLHNNIILNINGATNINNFHTAMAAQAGLSMAQHQGGQTVQGIHGRKIDMPQLRVGQDIEEDNIESDEEKEGWIDNSYQKSQELIKFK